MRFTIEDCTKKDYVGTTLTTEDPSKIRRWASSINPERTLAICGGGEIPLLSLLPYSGKVVAVDISARSIAYAALKALLLEENSPGPLKDFLSKEYETAKIHLSELGRALPAPFASLIASDLFLGGSTIQRRYGRFRALWQATPDDVLEHSRNNLDRLVLTHADIGAYAPQETFDLVYASNAIGFNDSSLKPIHFAKHLGFGGHLIRTDHLKNRPRYTEEVQRFSHPDPNEHLYTLERKKSFTIGYLIDLAGSKVAFSLSPPPIPQKAAEYHKT